MFKKVLACEPIHGRKMRQNPVCFRPVASHIFASNEVPSFDSNRRGIRRRVLPVRFHHALRRDELDAAFVAKVGAELPGVVNWAIAGGLRALRRGSFIRPPDYDEIHDEIEYGSDPVPRFVRDCVEQAPPGARPVSTQDVFRGFKAHGDGRGMDTSGWHPSSHARRILQELRRRFGTELTKPRGVPHYSNIRLKPAR